MNLLKLLVSVFTVFHSDSFLHFSLYKTMFLQELLYYMGFFHQFLMQSQQNSLVSLLVPKVMYPSLRFRSYMPCGITTPSENELKSWSSVSYTHLTLPTILR